MGSARAAGTYSSRLAVRSMLSRTFRDQMIMHQQDQTIDTISGTLNTIQEQAGLMGREINEHNEYV